MKFNPIFKTSASRCALALLIVSALQIGCRDAERNAQKDLLKVKVAPAFSEKIEEHMDMVGQVVAKDKVNLMARISGFIVKQNFENGAYVKKGDILFEIQKEEYQALLEGAQADLMEAEAVYNNNLIDYNRQKTLVAKNAVSIQVYDDATMKKNTSEARVLRAKSALDLAQLNLDYTDIRAPFDGRIGIAAYSVGNLVSPQSLPLATLVKVNPVLVEFNISEPMLMTMLMTADDDVSLPEGTHSDAKFPEVAVKLFLSNGLEYPLEGEINFINNEINAMTGTILLRAQFNNPHQILVPGAYVKVRLQTKYKIDVLLVPQSALQQNQAGSYVLVVDDKNEVVSTNISVGDVYGENIAVLKGLKDGQNVIVEGLQKVRDGMTVIPEAIKPISVNSYSRSPADTERLQEKSIPEINVTANDKKD